MAMMARHRYVSTEQTHIWGLKEKPLSLATGRPFRVAEMIQTAAVFTVLTSIVAAFLGPSLTTILPTLLGHDAAGAQAWTRSETSTPFMTLQDGRNLSYQVCH